MTESNVSVGNIDNAGGEVNVAGRDIIKNIQILYERALTPGEVVEKDLQVERERLAQGVRDYLDGLKQQVLEPGMSVPYKELQAYTLSDAQVFFGRNRAIRGLLEAMQRGRMTVLQAESGAGKTSLLQAGIVPQLIGAQHLAMLIRPQFENPTQTIKGCFLRGLELTPILAKSRLVNFLRRVSGIIGHQTTLYLILDQFEEFFAKQTLEEDRQAFIRDLAECLNDATLNVRWVIAVTLDALGQMGKFEPHVRTPFSNVESLYLFSREQAAEVIDKTARHHGLSFEEGLLDRILTDLGNGRNDSIAPTQIQLVCAALYRDIKDTGTLFTHAQYDEKKGAQGILHGYIERVLRQELPLEERSVAFKVLEALVTSEKKRLIRSKSDLEVHLTSKGIAPETLEATLNHLVAGRLLRRHGDDPHRIQYEIVHDYLLGEIEINEAVRNAKEAEELVEQGVRNWDRRQLLLAPDAQEIIETRGGDIFISPAAAMMLFLSAIEYSRPPEKWLKLIPAQDQKSLTGSLLAKKRNRNNREALWHLREHLSNSEKAKIAAGRSSRAFWLSLRRAVLAVLIGAVVLFVSAILVDASWNFLEWTPVTGLGSQCLPGENPADLLVAIDARNASRVITYDPSGQVFCETVNTGVRWSPLTNTLPPGLVVHSIAVHSGLYLATDQGVYYQADDSNWKKLELPQAGDSAARKLAVSSDRGEIYVLTGQGRLYRLNPLSGQATLIDLQGVTGNIIDITANYDYLAVSTPDGIWYDRKNNPETVWEKFDARPYENLVFTSIEMVRPVKSWRHFLEDPVYDDLFLATTEKGEIYTGYLTGMTSLLREHSISPTPISSLAVNRLSKFSVRADGLYCEQTWYLYDAEWWLRFGSSKPCH